VKHQTREQIGDKLKQAQPQIVRDAYQYLLFELILDVLVDIRDILDERMSAD